MRLFYNVCISLAILCFSPNVAFSCGYDWVGSCSSSVHLSINGTLDSFIVADCPSGFRFDGQYLGTLKTLSLANARAITWESCQNNVSAVNLKYRVYEQGAQPGSFLNLSLDQDYFTLQGPYTTRYRSKASNISLSNGLNVGKTYVLEVYMVADIDTVGDDFIPETTIQKNNNGQNYKMTFTYGGPNAAPFVVIPTDVVQPNCHGDHNGTVGVSVWGDHAGLSYNWSNIPLNFFRQNNLAAGTYTVTVTGANYTTATTIVLNEPAVLAIQNADIQPVSCGGGQGLVAVAPSGGTLPYRYLWSDGQTTSTAHFSASGQYNLTLKDAHDCSLSQSFTVPGSGSLQKNISAHFCAGGVYQYGSNVFSAPGLYDFSVPGSGGCDTLIHLNLTATDPGTLFSSLPSGITVSCANPIQSICAVSDPGATYQWWKDNIPATATACLSVTAGGNYTIQATLAGCSAFKSVAVTEHLVPPLIQTAGVVTYRLDCYDVDSSFLHLSVASNAVNPDITWVLQGQVISTQDSFTIAYDDYPFASGFAVPTVQVNDAFGCSASKTPQFSIPPIPFHPYIFPNYFPDLCQMGVLTSLYVQGVQSPYSIVLNDSITVAGEFLVQTGVYDAVITDPVGCTSTITLYVPDWFNINVTPSTSSDFPTGAIAIQDTGFTASYLWDNGSIQSYQTGLYAGNYCVTIYDNEHGCAVDTCITVPGLTSGVEETFISSLFLAPNPVNAGAALEITLSEALHSGPMRIQLLDLYGKSVWSENCSDIVSSTQTILIPETLPAAMYTLVLQTEKSILTGKLCIKR